MCLRSSVAHILAACGVALAAPASADDLLEYLESRGLQPLAARRLELLADATTGDERAQHLDRLAQLYAGMLDAGGDASTQQALLERADALAESLSTQRGDVLRISAARTRYREAARQVEAFRAGAETDIPGVAAVLAAQAELLQRTADRAVKRADDLDRRMGRAEGVSADLLEEDIERERGLAGQARFLAAWCLLYRSTLTSDRTGAEKAIPLFADMLGGRSGAVAPDEVSEDLRGDEAYASAILGLALAKAQVAGFAEADRFLDLLEATTTHPSVRDRLAGWRLVAALDARAFAVARTELAATAEREDAANWARVAVARAAIEPSADAEASALLREGVAQLAAARDLSAIRALVARFGERLLGEGEDSFIRRYVRAVRLYEDAQQAAAAAGGVSAPPSPAAEASCRAAESLGLALEASDAGAFKDAAGACRLMRAWSLHGCGRFGEAAKAFDELAESSHGSRAEEAARLAVASLDAASRMAEGAERARMSAELVARIDAFMARFPGSAHVPAMLVRKIASVPEPRLAEIEVLLKVPPDSPDWLESRRQALGALYRAFRGGSEPRPDTGRRYVALLSELPRDPATGLPAGSASIARQALEVALSNEIRDARLAGELLESLGRAAAAGSFDPSTASEELAYRRLQVAILEDRWADVEPLLAAFETEEATPLWADAALRLALRGAEARRRASAAESAARGAFVATVVRAGDAIIARAGGPSKAADEPAIAAIARIVLDARAEMLAASADRGQAERGLALAEALLARAPRDAALLRACAMCAEASGDLGKAAEHLRSLVGGLPPRTEPWFAAKVDQLRVLAALDPARARAVLAQHRALYPDIGPEPWKSRMLAVEGAMNAAPAPGPEGGAP